MIEVENWNGEGKFDPCTLYNWRLNWLEGKIKQHRASGIEIPEPQYEKWFDEEEKVYQNNKRDMEKVDKLNKPIAIVVPSHAHQRLYLYSCLKSCQETGYFTVLAYDNPFYSSNLKLDERVPDIRTFCLADMLLMKHKTWGSGVGIPHAWNMFYAMKLIQSLGFKYTFNINGDCMMQNPKGIEEIFELLVNKGADIIACEWIPERKYCGTMSWLAKTDVAAEIWFEYIKKLYHFNVGNAEARMGKHIIEGGYSVVEVENPEEAHFKPPGVLGTWRKVLGFRHLHAEHKVRRKEGMEPIERVLLNEIFLSGFEKKTLLKYYETGDYKYLDEWHLAG